MVQVETVCWLRGHARVEVLKALGVCFPFIHLELTQVESFAQVWKEYKDNK